MKVNLAPPPGFEPGSEPRQGSMIGHYTTGAERTSDSGPVFNRHAFRGLGAHMADESADNDDGSDEMIAKVTGTPASPPPSGPPSGPHWPTQPTQRPTQRPHPAAHQEARADEPCSAALLQRLQPAHHPLLLQPPRALRVWPRAPQL